MERGPREQTSAARPLAARGWRRAIPPRARAPLSSSRGRAGADRSAAPSRSRFSTVKRSWISSGTTSSPATMFTRDAQRRWTSALAIAQLTGGHPVDDHHRRAAERRLEGRRSRGDEGEVRVREQGVEAVATTAIPRSRAPGNSVSASAGARRATTSRSNRLCRRAAASDMRAQSLSSSLGRLPGIRTRRRRVFGGSGEGVRRPSSTSSTSGWPAHTASAPCAPIDLGLEGKERDDPAGAAGDRAGPPATPGPYLRADVVDDRDAVALQPPRQESVEIGKVDDHRRLRPAREGRLVQSAQGAAQRGKLLEHLRDADDRQRLGPHHRIEPRLGQPRPSHAERGDTGTAKLERPEQACAVEVAGSLARGEEEVHALPTAGRDT